MSGIVVSALQNRNLSTCRCQPAACFGEFFYELSFPMECIISPKTRMGKEICSRFEKDTNHGSND